jgi:multiple sugar transport system ATP-binding protein
MIEIGVRELRKAYVNGVTALDGVTLHIPAGQCLALVGPSGCGKTTLLRVIAGLEAPSSGTIEFNGRSVNHLPAHRRDVAIVFQRPALVLGLTVYDNLAWSWMLRERWPLGILQRLFGRSGRSAEQERDLGEVARLLGIDGLLGRLAGELSGGQQQRVALGRALLRRAPVCLLDEPLGHLEAALRTQLRRDLRLLSQRFPATMVHVTHDPAEALAVGDRVAVLHDGRLQQVGSAKEVLRRPANRFVAAFCRPQGPLNFLEGRTVEAGDAVFVAAPWLRLKLQAHLSGKLDGRGVMVGIPAEQIKILHEPTANWPAGHIIPMEVALTEFAPEGTWVTCRRDGLQLTGLWKPDRDGSGPEPRIGSNAMLAIALDNAFWFDAATGVTLATPEG